MKIQLATLVAAVAVTGVASADVVVDTTPTNNQANLSVAAGQTFTTGTLTDTTLSTIEIFGPSGAAGTDPLTYGISFHLDGDQDDTTWDPGASLGEAAAQLNTAGGSVVFDLTGAGITLADNTVYTIQFTDGAGTAAAARVGLTNNAGDAITDGSVFSAAAIPFGGAFDTVMIVNTVPEPGSLALLGLGGLALVRRRRK